MAKKISLQLEIGGVKKSVSNINELESALSEANKELKGLEIGSEAFNKLSGQIKKAKDTAEDLQESLKGQDLEKRVGAYAKVGSAIVSSFAAAQATISLFGEESEQVAKAAAQAQAVLTIALTAREVAEGLVAVKTVAANIATVASAAAANAANVATKALYTTIAANPYGAILAVIGAVAGALLYFTSTTEKAENAQRELSKAFSEQAQNLKLNLITLQSLNTSQNLRLETVKELKKEYPGFNAFIDKENRLNAAGKRFLELKIEQYEKEAKIKIALSRINDLLQKNQEILSEDVRESVSIWDELGAALRQVGSIRYIDPVVEQLQENNEQVQKNTNLINVYEEELRKLKEDYANNAVEIEKYNKLLEDEVNRQNKVKQATDDAAKTKQQLADAYKQGLTAAIDLTRGIDALTKELEVYTQTIQKLESLTLEAPITEQLNGILQARKQAIAATRETTQIVQEQIKALNTGLLPKDPLIKQFQELREALEKEFTKVGTSAFKGFNEIYNKFVRDNKELNQAQKEFLADIIVGYQDVVSFINKVPGFDTFINSLKNVNVEWDNFREGGEQSFDAGRAFLNILGEITAANKKYVQEFVKIGENEDYLNQLEKLGKVVPLQFDPIKVRENAAKYIKDIEDALIRPLSIRLVTLEIEAQKQLEQTAIGAEKSKIQGYIQQLENLLLTIPKLTNEQVIPALGAFGGKVESELKTISTGFVNLVGAVTTAEQKIIQVNNQVKLLTKQLEDDPAALGKAIGGVLLQSSSAIIQVLTEGRTKQEKLDKQLKDKLKANDQELFDFRKMLVEKKILTEYEAERVGQEELLKLYLEYKKKEKDIDDQSNKDKKDSFNQTLSDIGRGIQQFQQYLGEAASLVNLRIQTDIESLAIESKRLQDAVVGDSEEAAAQRLEIQAEYEARRKELEKKARVSSLQFSLAQALANAAQGITRTIAEFGFPIAAPLIAIQAGLTAAEIAIIADQISNAQSLRRGGLVKAQGGMLLSGPTHEQGGIPLAQMGVIAEGQEAIINRNSLINYRDLLSTINQAGGGRPLVVNNFDDTRIVEAIAEQKQKPLRAYVLQSEITNQQALSKRLDELSKI